MWRAAVWMVLAALAWPALGCGGDDGGDGEGSTSELEQLVSALEEVTDSPTRSQVEMSADTESDGSFSMTGEMESHRGRSRIDVHFEQGADEFDMEILQHERVAWMRSPVFDGLLPPGKTWIRTTDPQSVGGTTLTPGQFGELIEEAGKVEELGRERVGRVDARHLRAVVGIEELAEKAGQSMGLFGGSDADVPLDVWLGPDGRPVRLYLKVELPAENGSAPQQVVVDMDELEYGVPVDTRPPPAATVADESVLE